MRKILTVVCVSIGLTFPFINYAADADVQVQTKPVTINKDLVEKIRAIPLDSSSAHKVEELIGPPNGCMSFAPQAETWSCQWKGNLNSNRIQDTISIIFESGMWAQVIAVSKDGTFYTVKPGESVKTLKL